MLGMDTEWTSLGPAHWSTRTHKSVTVTVDNGHELRGLVVTVDPVSASLVLLDGAEVRLVLGHAVKEVQVLDSELDPDQSHHLEMLFRENYSAVDRNLDLNQTRTRLLDWIRLNRVPVEMKGAGLSVAGGVVTVNPPFRVQDCVGLNQVVLDRVQRLIQSQPQDQEKDQGQNKDHV